MSAVTTSPRGMPKTTILSLSLFSFFITTLASTFAAHSILESLHEIPLVGGINELQLACL